MTEYPRILETPDPALYLQHPRVLSALTLHAHIAEPANNVHLSQNEPWAEDYTWAAAYGETVRACRSMAQRDGDMMQYWLMGHNADGSGYHLAGRVTLYERAGAQTCLGYHVGLADSRRGFATTASRRLVAHARDVWGINTVLLRISEGNTASQGVARKLGALPTDRLVTTMYNGQAYTRRQWRWVLGRPAEPL